MTAMNTESVKRWQRGDVIIFRYVENKQSIPMVHAYMGDPALIAGIPFLVNGEIVTHAARPYVVVQDTEEMTALYVPNGTPMPRWRIPEGRLVGEPARSKGESLRLLFPGKAYDVTLFFDTQDPPWFYDGLFGEIGTTAGWRERRAAGIQDEVGEVKEHGRFRGWYVNLQTPFVRNSFGVDVVDQALDIVIRPDRSWYWKDEDELEMAVAKGACSPAHAESIRDVGRELIPLIEAGLPPFDEERTTWRPTPDLVIKEIPDGWQYLSPLIPDGDVDKVYS